MREARIAGSNPEIMPMNVVNAITPTISHSGNDMKLLIGTPWVDAILFPIAFIILARPKLKTSPITHPIKPRVAASKINMFFMLVLVAPHARSIPISLVLS